MVPIQLLSTIQDACDQHFKRFVSICTILAAAWIEKNQIGDSEEGICMVFCITRTNAGLHLVLHCELMPGNALYLSFMIRIVQICM